MIIMRKIELDYGHTLPKHFGFCNQIHGHRAVVEGYFYGGIIEDAEASNNGMVEDFSVLKTILMEEIHSILDHGFAIWEKDNELIEVKEGIFISTIDFIKARNKKYLILPSPPTAEILVTHFAERIISSLRKKNSQFGLYSLVWFETPNNKAIYTNNLKS